MEIKLLSYLGKYLYILNFLRLQQLYTWLEARREDPYTATFYFANKIHQAIAFLLSFY